MQASSSPQLRYFHAWIHESTSTPLLIACRPEVLNSRWDSDKIHDLICGPMIFSSDIIEGQLKSKVVSILYPFKCFFLPNPHSVTPSFPLWQHQPLFVARFLLIPIAKTGHSRRDKGRLINCPTLCRFTIVCICATHMYSTFPD
jgi:hypothetical protein